MKPFEYYNDTGPYPEEPSRPLMPARGSNSAAFQDYTEKLKECEKQFKEYKIARDKWNDKRNLLFDEFKRDVISDFGLAGHPKADRIFAKAWESGHAYGYPEVYSHFADLAELFEDDTKNTSSSTGLLADLFNDGISAAIKIINEKHDSFCTEGNVTAAMACTDIVEQLKKLKK